MTGAPFFITRPDEQGRALALGVLRAPTIHHAQELAEALFGRLDPITGELDVSGIAAWHQCQDPKRYETARSVEWCADHEDRLTCIMARIEREKHNH